MCLGIPGQVIHIKDAATLTATVDICGVQRDINMACVVDEQHSLSDSVGEWVLVHVGFAMSRIDPRQAAQTLQLLEELGDMDEELAVLNGETP